MSALTRSSGKETLRAIAMLFEDVEFISLKTNERWMLVELLALANRNPGEPVNLSSRRAARLCNFSEPEARRTLDELCECGFIERLKVPTRSESQWRLTMLPFNDVPATHDYRKIFRRCENSLYASLVEGGSFLTKEMERRFKISRARNRATTIPDGEAELLEEKSSRCVIMTQQPTSEVRHNDADAT
jgi:hypothetical protein